MGWNPEHPILSRSKSVIALTVRDTGIGIPPEKQQIIFEAFQQADGSTSRKYGGTGLGLAISREISGVLGGELKLVSAPTRGSSFTLYLPVNYTQPKTARRATTREVESHVVATAPADQMPEAVPVIAEPPPATDVAVDGIEDDMNRIGTGDRVLLVVENDINFARLLVDVGREQGFKVAIATRGSAAIQLARKLLPTAITLDINLPDLDGWRVLNRLKDEVATRHIPVQIVTTEEERARGLRMGAMGVLTKPIKTKDSLDQTFTRLAEFIAPHPRRLLLIEPDAEQRDSLVGMIAGEDLQIASVGTAAEAVESLQQSKPDLIIVSFELPDRKSFDLIDEIKEDTALQEVPMIVLSRKELSKKDELHLKRLTQTTVLKDVRSNERLADEVALFLHRPLGTIPETVRGEIEKLHQPGTVLAGKKVLVVDDDVRNIFAMTSILEPYSMEVLPAETGRGAIETLQSKPDVDVVLMDIMMPDMDGYDTMRAIRRLAKFRSLPIIALTAKAMKGDREKCIEAGASDYVSKPVDTEQLLAVLRMWLHR
jgi:CheY-like chemotaxis protein